MFGMGVGTNLHVGLGWWSEECMLVCQRMEKEQQEEH